MGRGWWGSRGGWVGGGGVQGRWVGVVVIVGVQGCRVVGGQGEGGFRGGRGQGDLWMVGDQEVKGSRGG